MNKLQRLLNTCIRFIVGLPNDENADSYSKSLHILPVKYRIKYKLCLTVFKILNGLSPDYLKDKITPVIPSDFSFLRSSLDLTKLELPKFDNTYKYSMAKNWNMLPITLRSCGNIENFKKQLKTHYFSIAYS